MGHFHIRFLSAGILILTHSSAAFIITGQIPVGNIGVIKTQKYSLNGCHSCVVKALRVYGIKETPMIKAILLSMVVASVSFFVTHSQLLERQRKWLWKNYDNIAELLECCYCLGHWIAAAALLLLPVRLFGIWEPADYALTWLVIAWLAGLQSLAASQLWGE